MFQLPKVLWFVNGVKPSADEMAAAAAMKAKVCFRNATAVPNEPHALEQCDGVAGEVPKVYKTAFPSAEMAIANFEQGIQKLKASAQETEAPKPSGNKLPPADTKPQTQKPPANVWNPNA